MAITSTSRIIFFVLLMMTFTFLLGCCSPKIYKVRDSEGWTAKENVYYEWAERKEFHAGDSLIFEYDPNFNDVTQASGALKYEFCDTSSPKVVYNTGHDIVTLSEPGSYYFNSSNQAQCISGQKLGVLVVHNPTSRVLPPPPSTIFPPFRKIYKVGDSKGWSEHVDNDYYSKWSEDKELYLGDVLLFKYSNDLHDVLEINSDLEFLSCDPTSPVVVYKTRHDLVMLTKLV